MKPSTITSATWSKLWLFKQNQIPAIGAWLDSVKYKAVMATCLVAGGFVIGQIASESEMVSRSESVRLDGMSEGTKLANYDFKGAIKREMFKTEKVVYCMDFWFKEDHTFVGKALQAVKVSQ